jgi:hypothetical protein
VFSCAFGGIFVSNWVGLGLRVDGCPEVTYWAKNACRRRGLSLGHG